MENLCGFYSLNLKALQFRYPQYAENLSCPPADHESLFAAATPLENTPKSSFACGLAFQNRLNAVILLDASLLPNQYAEIAGNPFIGIVVIEPDNHRIQTILASGDFREMILSSYVFWFLGAEWETLLAEWIAQQGVYLIPPSDICFYSEFTSLGDAEKTFLNRVKQTLATAVQTERKLFQLSEAKWRRSFSLASPGNPSKIWAYGESQAPVYRRITQAMLRAFAEQGWEIQQSEFQAEWANGEKITSELVHFSPDMLFFLNGPSAAIFKYLRIHSEIAERIPGWKLTWYVDHPRYLSGSIMELQNGDGDDIAVMDRTYFSEFQASTPSSIFHLPAAAVLDRRGIERKDRKYPILYVGSIVDPRTYVNQLSGEAQRILLDSLHQPANKTMPTWEEWNKRFQLSPALSKEMAHCALRFNQQRMKKHFSTAEQNWDYFLYVVTTFQYRWRQVQALLPFGLHIYGPEDWLSLLEIPYQDRYHGILRWENMPDAFASARINLNFHSRQCPTSLNFRDFDIPRAGGFLLSDYVEDMDCGYLETGNHLRVFHSTEELQELATYYLQHEEERIHIAETGCAWVTQHHTMRERAKVILQQLNLK